MSDTEYRGFKLVGDRSFGLVAIKPLGKGSVPKELRDNFTTKGLAQKAVDVYLTKSKVTESGNKD